MLHLCGPETVVFHLPLELRHGVCAAVTRHAFKTSLSPPAQNNGATSAPVHYGIVGLEVLLIVGESKKEGEGMQRSHYHAELYANNPRMLLERKTAGRSGAVKLS